MLLNKMLSGSEVVNAWLHVRDASPQHRSTPDTCTPMQLLPSCLLVQRLLPARALPHQGSGPLHPAAAPGATSSTQSCATLPGAGTAGPPRLPGCPGHETPAAYSNVSLPAKRLCRQAGETLGQLSTSMVLLLMKWACGCCVGWRAFSTTTCFTPEVRQSADYDTGGINTHLSTMAMSPYHMRTGGRRPQGQMGQPQPPPLGWSRLRS